MTCHHHQGSNVYHYRLGRLTVPAGDNREELRFCCPDKVDGLERHRRRRHL